MFVNLFSLPPLHRAGFCIAVPDFISFHCYTIGGRGGGYSVISSVADWYMLLAGICTASLSHFATLKFYVTMLLLLHVFSVYSSFIMLCILYSSDYMCVVLSGV